MGASAGVGLAAKVLTAVVVVPNAAVLAGAAAGVLAVNTVRYIKERTAERSAIQENATLLHQRTWGKPPPRKLAFTPATCSASNSGPAIWSGTISAATFGLFSLGEAVSDTVQEAFFTPQASAPELPTAQTPLPEAPVKPISEAPAPAITDQPDTSTVEPVEEIEGIDHLPTAKELIKNSGSASKAAQATYLRAEAGNAQAIKDLAYYFQNGKAGLPVDKDLARALFEQAALDGNKQALADLQWMEGYGAPLYNPAAKIASGAANHVAAAAGHTPAPSSLPPVTAAHQAVADIAPSRSFIPEETRHAALASVGAASPQTEAGLPAGRLAAECRPTVTSSANGQTSMLANCRYF